MTIKNTTLDFTRNNCSHCTLTTTRLLMEKENELTESNIHMDMTEERDTKGLSLPERIHKYTLDKDSRIKELEQELEKYRIIERSK